MKNLSRVCYLLFIICYLLFVISSCGDVYEKQAPGTITVINTSEKYDVDYILGNEAERTLEKKVVDENKDEFANFPLYTFMKSYKPENRLLLDTKYPHKNDITYTFIDRKSYAVEVFNTTGMEVTISAGEWMDKDIEIDPALDPDPYHVWTDPNWLVYTDKPTFTAVFSNLFPADVTQVLESDVFKVTVK